MMNKFLAWIGFKPHPDYEAKYNDLRAVNFAQDRRIGELIDAYAREQALHAATADRLRSAQQRPREPQTPRLTPTGRKPSVPEIQNFPSGAGKTNLHDWS